jgi:uncharacterized protein DUF5615
VKLKLDENLGERWTRSLGEAGHDVVTVREQDLAGADDLRVIQVARAEGRCFVTLDLDFANPLRFWPPSYAGIAVLRLPVRPTVQDLDDAVATLVAHLTRTNITGRLCIVEVGRVREYQPPDGESAD